MQRRPNFSAGPGALPLEVLEQAQRELVDFRGTGMSLMEMSHRAQTYDQVHCEAIDDLRTLLGISDDYAVLFMQGGARGQFAMVPMNLLREGTTGHYLDTGRWANGAAAEAAKLGTSVVEWSSEDRGYDRVPSPQQWLLPETAAYLHYTSNNTIYGTQYHQLPDCGDVPLICDMSSDILSSPVDVSRFGLIYAGAQKNMGPAGVTTVIVRRDLLEHSSSELPEVMNYRLVAAKNSMLNTPPVFPIYMVGLVAKHLLRRGGLEAIATEGAHKAELLYRIIDESAGFFAGHAEAESRSRMNVTFRMESPELEKLFVEESSEAGMVGLRGHRSVGGLRASIYNGVPLGAVEQLAEFMEDFKKRRG